MIDPDHVLLSLAQRQSLYSSNGEVCVTKLSKTVLKKLAQNCLIEVETRTCAPWTFGHKGPNFNLTSLVSRNLATQAQIDDYRKQVQQHSDDFQLNKQRRWHGRTEVWAWITNKGYKHLEALGLKV